MSKFLQSSVYNCDDHSLIDSFFGSSAVSMNVQQQYCPHFGLKVHGKRSRDFKKAFHSYGYIQSPSISFSANFILVENDVLSSK